MIFGSVKVAEWPPSGKERLILFTTCSLCIIYIVILVVFHFAFEGGTLVLIVPVPGNCLPYF